MKREDAEKLIKKVEKDVKKALAPISKAGGSYIVTFTVPGTDDACLGLNGSGAEIGALLTGIAQHLLDRAEKEEPDGN